MTKFKKVFKIIVIILVVFCILVAFLVAPRMFSKPDMSAFMGASVAHRGYFDNEAGIPENSLASFRAAIEKGFVIELDIQLSSDGVAFVFHDADLERMCNVQGKIWDYTAAELTEMKLLGTEETIPTFEAFKGSLSFPLSKSATMKLLPPTNMKSSSVAASRAARVAAMTSG